jgi:hypothetical protein
MRLLPLRASAAFLETPLPLVPRRAERIPQNQREGGAAAARLVSWLAAHRAERARNRPAASTALTHRPLGG